MLNNYLTIYKKFVLKIVVYLVYNMNREEDCFIFFFLLQDEKVVLHLLWQGRNETKIDRYHKTCIVT